jgi:hypothetical protein
MSFASTIEKGFKSIPHFLAVGFKYVALGVGDVVKVANKAQALEPEVDAVVAALAGPQAAAISDLAFHVLGDVAAALTAVGTDAATGAATTTVNLSFDAQFVNDVKTAALQIEKIFQALGKAKPAK